MASSQPFLLRRCGGLLLLSSKQKPQQQQLFTTIHHSTTTISANTLKVLCRFSSTTPPSSPSSPAEARGNGNPSRFWSNNPLTGRSQRPIFVAATKQHVGKTTTCLALLSGLKKRFNNVGFLKPVGQQHVEVVDNNNNQLRVDKDVVLIKEHFHLDHIDYSYMSPVIIPSGYTKRYVDGEITLESQKHEVESAMEQVAVESDITLIEGMYDVLLKVDLSGLVLYVMLF